jgi:hypothetical protein
MSSVGGMGDMPDEETMAADMQRAKDLVLAFSISQVGGHELAHLEVDSSIDELEDAQTLYLVIRMFSGLVAAFAEHFAIENDAGLTSAEREGRAIEAIRAALDGLGGIPRPLDP